jgi:hypothetical protein
MPIVEYKLHKVGKNALRAPEWVDDGGYWQNPADNTMVGWVPAEADREYYVPDTVSELTRDQFITRLTTMHAANAFSQPSEGGEPTDMTEAEVQTMAGDWYDSFHA